MELLHQKLAYNSPKATNKHFVFPSEPQVRISPPKSSQNMRKQPITNHNNFQNYPQEDAVNSSFNNKHSITTANFNQGRSDPHYQSNPSFNRHFLSPQDHRNIRI